MASETPNKQYFYKLEIRSEDLKFTRLIILELREADAEQLLKFVSNQKNCANITDKSIIPTDTEQTTMYTQLAGYALESTLEIRNHESGSNYSGPIPPPTPKTVEEVKLQIIDQWKGIADVLDAKGPVASFSLYIFLDDTLIGDWRKWIQPNKQPRRQIVCGRSP